MDTKLRTYPSLYERLIVAVPFDGLTNDLVQKLVEECVARCVAEQRVKELEERCMWAEGTLAGLRAELAGLVERVRVAAL